LVEREEEALNALAGRIGALRNDSSLVAASLAEGQDAAARKWRETIEALQQRVRDAIEEITRVDSVAMDSAHKRLAAIKDEAARVDLVMHERTAAFEDQVAQRRADGVASVADTVEQIGTWRAALDVNIAERLQAHIHHVEAVASRSDSVAAKLADLGREMVRIVDQGGEHEERLSAALAAL